MTGRINKLFYGAALFTLPWIGLGVLQILTGRDWGGGLQPSWLLLALAMLTAAGTMFRVRIPDPWLWSGGAVAVAIVLSVSGIWAATGSGTVAEALGKYVKQVIQLGIMGAFVVWPALWTRGRERWRWTVVLLASGAAFQAGYGLLQLVEYYRPLGILAPLERLFTSNPAILSGSSELYLGDTFRHVPRLRGTACEPLYLGNFLLLAIPLTLSLGTDRLRRWAPAAVFGLLLLLTWSRGAWLGFLFQCLLTCGLFWRLNAAGAKRTRLPQARTIAAAGAGLLLVPALVGLLGATLGWDGLLYPWQRLLQTFSNQDWSNLTRLYSMEAAWKAFLSSPVVGVGWGQFGWHFPLLVDPMGLQSQFTWPVVNNFYLQVLCETGLVGFLVMSALGLGLLRGVWRRLGTPGGNSGWTDQLLVWTTVAFAGVWLQMVSFSQYNLPHIWVALGLLLAATREWDSNASSRQASLRGDHE
jgi:hypothetical protein